ncbi:galactokinase [Pediococcus stilesii]|uniref:Galactokinase n=1 Tax=Pediococcus stilesii TaxID=331679 RepID=A0A5R9BTY6_9LACO|nr:galactokinase [Pediococcus stilesii]TLQ03472.1 galactokinase [Pediococcus stilesii]
MDKEAISAKFNQIFNTEAEEVYFSPGRINLIGEHTDYNGGHVFPCAISLGTYGGYRNREDSVVKMFSGNLADTGVIEFDVNDLDFDKKYQWSNYLRGMMLELRKLTQDYEHGFELYLEGDLPDGAGLSSSASIEMLMGTILNEQFELHIDPIEIVKAGQRVENNYIGVNSGIMDQFAVEMGKRNEATFLDTNTMEYDYSPLDLGKHIILIMNTNKPHELVNSEYNTRRSECEQALSLLQTKLNIKALGELSNDAFDQYTYLIHDETLIKRARHAVFENQRTIAAKAALNKGDLNLFGRLVSASHISLQYDYEVSAPELDLLVNEAWKHDGVLGARMIGGGFGGCAIALVEKDQVDDLIETLGAKYQEKIGYAADFYEAEIVDGPHQI